MRKTLLLLSAMTHSRHSNHCIAEWIRKKRHLIYCTHWLILYNLFHISWFHEGLLETRHSLELFVLISSSLVLNDCSKQKLFILLLRAEVMVVKVKCLPPSMWSAVRSKTINASVLRCWNIHHLPGAHSG